LAGVYYGSSIFGGGIRLGQGAGFFGDPGEGISGQAAVQGITSSFGGRGRMEIDRYIQLLSPCKELFKLGMVKVSALGRSVDERTLKAKLRDRAL
jgi:hypothetical protein